MEELVYSWGWWLGATGGVVIVVAGIVLITGLVFKIAGWLKGQ